MSAKPFRISLKPSERIYVNGAVIRVDRRVSLEFLNDVQFLLENHVMQAEQADTPLRQLYFIVQIMVMSPNDSAAARALFRERLKEVLAGDLDGRTLAELKTVDQWVSEGKVFPALRVIRNLFAQEVTLQPPPLAAAG
jgi:flagellar protein FlbT